MGQAAFAFEMPAPAPAPVQSAKIIPFGLTQKTALSTTREGPSKSNEPRRPKAIWVRIDNYREGIARFTTDRRDLVQLVRKACETGQRVTVMAPSSLRTETYAEAEYIAPSS